MPFFVRWRVVEVGGGLLRSTQSVLAALVLDFTVVVVAGLPE